MSSTLVRAAQYLRMSSEPQVYSVANQQAAIREYAARYGYDIVRTYQDPGRSGVILRNRPGLQSLLTDVVGGKTDFQAVLVYDVSRWGRFQDCDESAHYEFICRTAGIPVHYCAEPFENNGTMLNLIVKALKRAMAAEYSRELGVKCFDSQKRLAELGFRVGGQAGFGLRRMVISSDGKRRWKLRDHEYKSLVSDRVILVPGPPREVDLVRKIFSMALHKNVPDIVRELNAQQILGPTGGRWKYDRVRGMLKNPKYVGCNVWARKTAKLQSRVRVLEPQEWITCPGAFKPIVSQQLFDAVQAAHKKRSRKMSDDDLLNGLRRLLARSCELSEDVIRRHRGLPSSSTYVRRFGSLNRTYQLIGYKPSQRSLLTSVAFRKFRQRQESLVANIVEMLPGRATHCTLHHGRAGIKLKSGATVAIQVCKGYTSGREKLVRWRLRPIVPERGLITLLALLDTDNTSYHAFYVMPGIDKVGEYQIKGEADPWLKAGRRLHYFSELCTLVSEINAGVKGS